MAAKHTHIVSTTPHRTRFKVSPKRRNREEMARLAQGLAASPGVHDVQTNVHTGSLVVHHAPGHLDQVRSVLTDLGVILAHATSMDIPEGDKTMSWSLTKAVSDLNTRIAAATGGTADLRVLIPLGFGSIAVLQLLRKGLQIEAAPWYMLAYLAYDTFLSLNPNSQSSAAEARSA